MSYIDEQTRDKIKQRARTSTVFIASILINAVYLQVWSWVTYGMNGMYQWMETNNPEAYNLMKEKLQLLRVIIYYAGVTAISISIIRDISSMIIQTWKAVAKEAMTPVSYGTEPAIKDTKNSEPDKTEE